MCIRNTFFVDSVDNNQLITVITTFCVWIRLWKLFLREYRFVLLSDRLRQQEMTKRHD